ncbi:terpene synthase family protein [Kitasatospora sp. NPDC003701]
MFDDQFDSTDLGHRLPDTAAVVDHMTAAIEHPPTSSLAALHPFSLAATDLLAGIGEIMSPVWMRRHRHHLARWWSGIVQAVVHRTTASGSLPFEERLQIRRRNVGMHSFDDLVELACNWEMPPALSALPDIKRIRALVSDITLFQNDMCSVDKERAGGCDDNVLLAWEGQGHTPEQGAGDADGGARR